MSEQNSFGALALLWDYRAQAIINGADKLEAMPEAERERALQGLRDSVTTQANSLSDDWLVATATFMVEDLYKSYFCGFRWTPTVVDYLSATAAVFLEVLARRGFVVHYIVDNTMGEMDARTVFTYLPLIFHASGLMVTGPQLAALEILERRDGRPNDVAGIPAVLADGQQLAERLATRFHSDRRSSVYLNLELDDDTPGLSM